MGPPPADGRRRDAHLPARHVLGGWHQRDVQDRRARERVRRAVDPARPLGAGEHPLQLCPAADAHTGDRVPAEVEPPAPVVPRHAGPPGGREGDPADAAGARHGPGREQDRVAAGADIRMTETIACLSPLTEHQVRELAGSEDVKVLVAPDPPAPQAGREIVAEADVVIADMSHRHRLDRETLAAMVRCRLIQQPAVGFDVIDYRAAAEFGIPVANAAGFNADTVADWTLMGMLNIVRHGARLDCEMRAGGWRPTGLRSRDMRALTVGIVGMGNIGRQVAARVAAF